jgi:hypothetical protein
VLPHHEVGTAVLGGPQGARADALALASLRAGPRLRDPKRTLHSILSRTK